MKIKIFVGDASIIGAINCLKFISFQCKTSGVSSIFQIHLMLQMSTIHKNYKTFTYVIPPTDVNLCLI